MMFYLKAAFAALNAAGLITKLIAGGLVLASIATAYAVWHHKVYQSGVNDTIAAIAREDQRYIKRALDARSKLQDCRDLSRHWDQTTGRCQ